MQLCKEDPGIQDDSPLLTVTRAHGHHLHLAHGSQPAVLPAVTRAARAMFPTRGPAPTMALAAMLAAAAVAEGGGSAAPPPGLWFWGGGSPASLAAIKSFTTALGTKAPTIYYSIGGYSIGPGGSFAGSQNGTLVKEMKGMGIKLHATVGATNITSLRELFKAPQPYIDAAVKAAVASGIDGYNLDWEPYVKGMTKWTPGDEGDVNNQDGLAYATFLDAFAHALHQEHKELSLDFFTDRKPCHCHSYHALLPAAGALTEPARCRAGRSCDLEPRGDQLDRRGHRDLHGRVRAGQSDRAGVRADGDHLRRRGAAGHRRLPGCTGGPRAVQAAAAALRT